VQIDQWIELCLAYTDGSKSSTEEREIMIGCSIIVPYFDKT